MSIFMRLLLTLCCTIYYHLQALDLSVGVDNKRQSRYEGWYPIQLHAQTTQICVNFPGLPDCQLEGGVLLTGDTTVSASLFTTTENDRSVLWFAWIYIFNEHTDVENKFDGYADLPEDDFLETTSNMLSSNNPEMSISLLDTSSMPGISYGLEIIEEGTNPQMMRLFITPSGTIYGLQVAGFADTNMRDRFFSSVKINTPENEF